MNNDVLEIKLNFNVVGNAPEKLKDLADSTKKVGSEEDRLIEKAKKRHAAQQEAAKVQATGVKLGLWKGPATEEEKHQQALQRTITLMERKKRIAEDLVKLGVTSGPKSPEQEYGEKLNKRIAAHHERQRMDRDLILSGVKKDPAVMRQEADARRQAAEAEREQARRQQTAMAERIAKSREDENRQNRTWVALLSGHPMAAGINAMMAPGPAGLAFAALQGVGHTMRMSTGIGNVAQNKMLTADEANRGMYKQLLGGETFLNFLDMATGRSEAMREVQEEKAPRIHAYSQGNIEKQAAYMGIAPQMYGARNRAEALSRLSTAPEEDFDRHTLSGDVAFRNAQRLLPLQDKLAMSSRVAAAAKADEVGAAIRLQKIEEKMHARRGEQERLLETARNQFGSTRLETLHRAAAVGNEAEAFAGEAQQARHQYLGAKQARAQAEAAERQARTEIARGEMMNLEEKEGRITGNVGRLGGMNFQQRQLGVQAFQMLQANGLSNLPDFLREAARSVAPEFVRKEEEKFGENTPEYQRLKALGAFGSDTESLSAVREQLKEARTNVRAEIVLDSQQLAQAIADSFEESFGRMLENLNRVIDVKVNATIDKQKTGLQIGNAVRAG